MTPNNNNKNWFERFVDNHNQWKSKRHERKGQSYSDYDVISGFSFILSIITVIFWGFNVSMIFILVTILLFFMNNLEFKKKSKKNKDKIVDM